MGLFSRKNPYEKEALDLEAASADHTQIRMPRVQPMTANMPPQPGQAMPPQAQVPPPAVQQPRAAYGIEDAIRLMRELPDNKKEMVITIVQKTLLSAKINVNTIIDDAGRKIDRLEKKNEKLGQEIRELEEAITQRKSEMERNARDVEETREVKISFESANPRAMVDETQAQRYAPQHVQRTEPHHPMGYHRDREQPISHVGPSRDRDQPVSQSPLYIPSQKAG